MGGSRSWWGRWMEYWDDLGRTYRALRAPIPARDVFAGRQATTVKPARAGRYCAANVAAAA
jgi:hypothetical protein